MGALKAVSPAVVIVVLAVLAAAALCFLVFRLIQAKKGGVSAGLSLGGLSPHLCGQVRGLLSNPLVQRLVAHVVATAQTTHHAALDAGIVKLFPAAAPFLPVINAAADQVDARVAGTPAPPQPGDPATRPIIDFLEAHLAQLKGLKS